MSSNIEKNDGRDGWIKTEPVYKGREDQNEIRKKITESYGRKPTSSNKKQK